MGRKTGYVWSLDISTTNVGMALWYESGNLVELKHLELKVDRSIPEEERYLHKANQFKEYVVGYQARVKELYLAEIENVFVDAIPAGESFLWNKECGVECHFTANINVNKYDNE